VIRPFRFPLRISVDGDGKKQTGFDKTQQGGISLFINRFPFRDAGRSWAVLTERLRTAGRRSGGGDRKDSAMVSEYLSWKRLAVLFPLLFFLTLPALADARAVRDSAVSGVSVSAEGDKAEIIDRLVEAAKKLTREGRYTEALDDYNRAIELSPGDAVLYFERGSLYYFMIISAGAEALREAGSPPPSPAAAAGPGGVSNLDPAPLVRQNCDRALSDFNRAISLNENFDIFFHMRGSLLGSEFCPRRDTAQAVADFDRAIRINPSNAVYYLERGNLYAGLNRFDSALADIRKAVSMEPNNYYFHHDLGLIYERMQMKREAAEHYKKAMELAPPEQMPSLNRSLVLSRRDENRDLIGDYTDLIARRPEVSYLYIHRGSRLGDEGKLRQAIEDYSAAITLRRENGDLYLSRGKMFYDSGRKREALRDFKESCDQGNIGACCYRRITEQDIARGEGWIPFWYSRNHRRYFYDRKIILMKAKEGKVVRVLIEPDEAAGENAVASGDPDEPSLVLERWEFNCSRHQVRIRTQRKFDRNGRQIAHFSNFEPHFRPVFPGGISERLFRIVCPAEQMFHRRGEENVRFDGKRVLKTNSTFAGFP